MISLEKWYILTPLQKLPRNVRDLGKLIVAKAFKKLPKVQKIAQSGHTVIVNDAHQSLRPCGVVVHFSVSIFAFPCFNQICDLSFYLSIFWVCVSNFVEYGSNSDTFILSFELSTIAKFGL